MMANLPEEFEDLSPNQARYRLSETKLRLLNALARLEMMERDLNRTASGPGKEVGKEFRLDLIEPKTTGSTSSSNRAD